MWQRRDACTSEPELRAAMTALFELSWLGGATERRLHRRRGGIDALPWGTLDLREESPAIVEEARKVWTNGVFTEYASAAAFSAMTTAFLACGAPVDLVAFAADIVVDELFHVELSARLTTELGGATPLAFDLAAIAPATTEGARPLVRAAEIAITTSCVSETLSVPAMARSRALAKAPLVRAVLDRLLADEGAHARVGFWFLEWCEGDLTPDEKRALGELTRSTIEVYAPLFRDDECSDCPTGRGLGGHDALGREALRRAVDERILAPLAALGIR